MSAGTKVGHTPGPWEVVDSMYGGKSAVQIHPHYMVAEIDGRDDAEQEANARLIAAAPDMLAAVKDAKAIVDRIQDGAPDASPLSRDAAETYCRLDRLIRRVEES